MASKRALIVGLVAAVALALLAGSSRLQGLLANTALVAGGANALALPIGALMGLFIAKTDLPGRRWAGWLCAGLLFVPLYVQAAAWNAALSSGGWITQSLSGDGYAQTWFSGWRAAVWVHALAATPWVALLTAASLSAVERRLEEESLLDAPPRRVLLHVSLRRGAGGLWVGAFWTAIVCASEIAATDLYQVRTFAEEIYTQASLGPLTGDSASLLATDLGLGVALIMALVAVALRLTAPWLPAAASMDAEATWKWRPQRGRAPLALGVWALLAAIMLVPLASLVWKSGIAVHQAGGDYVRTWSPAKAASMIASSPWEHRREWGWSLAIGAAAAAAATVLGVVAAWVAQRRGWAAALLGAVAAFGLAVPAPLAGVWLIQAMNHSPQSPWSFLTTLYDRTLLAPIVAQFLRAAPLASIWLWSQFRSVPQDVLESARTEGAGPLAQLVRVVLPLRRTGVLVAAALALVIAVGELSATLLVSPPGVTTIAVREFQLLHYGVDDRVAALSLSIFLLLAGGTMAAGAAYCRANARRP
ncbi:MAG: hypothetical protein DCC67_17795 [Planctomycetota bacterium]|nr:MAG: hypothetical protein DCC67_17795 [Planctomycetota bacterium]